MSPPPFDMAEIGEGPARRWVSKPRGGSTGHRHVLHVGTDEGIEGICTVGDVRYTTMPRRVLEQLRILAVGSDPLDRERLNGKLRAATRQMFTPHGWFGAFDNCLWDIADKAAGLPVHALIGRVRETAPAYYNFRGDTKGEAAADARRAVALGFPAVKDHFHGAAAANIEWFVAVRDAVGQVVDIMHDAAGCACSFDEAVRIGRALEELGFRWFEEPLADRRLTELRSLCATLDIPIPNPETLMNDVDL